MKRLAALLLICACKTTSSAETHTALRAATEEASAAHVETRVEEAPTTTTTTVEEYGCDPTECSAATTAPAAHAAATAKTSTDGQQENAPDASTARRVLTKRTVTVEERGPVSTSTVADAKSQERGDSTLSSESATKSSTDFLHSPFALLGGLVALAGVAALFWKFRKVILP